MRLRALLTYGAPLLVLAVMVACGPSTTSESRSPGEAAFRRSCQSCHTLPRPSQKTDAEWPELVERYGQRANLSAEEIEQITAFLIAHN